MNRVGTSQRVRHQEEKPWPLLFVAKDNFQGVFFGCIAEGLVCLEDVLQLEAVCDELRWLYFARKHNFQQHRQSHRIN